MLGGLFGILRETEIEGPGEVLPAAINAACREQFLGANRTERFAQFVANEVLPAVAAGE